MVLNPNGYLFSSEGDGLKNYYTYAYHISHDTTLSEMEGMNFPYGENFLYTDGHPILSSALQKLNTISPFIGENAVGLLNVCMLLSMVLTFPVTFLLLKNFGISSWLAILFSIAIASLAPQVFRLQGHLALSYSVSIPLSWLMYLHYRDSDKKWLWLLILFLNGLFWLFVHAYLGVMIVFFLAMLSLFEKKIWAFVSLILPIALFFLVLKLTDVHPNRNTDALGFFLYNAELDDIFLPNAGPLKGIIERTFSLTLHQQWEAFGYVGFGFGLLAIYVVLFSFKSRVYGEYRDWETDRKSTRLNSSH